MLSATFVKMGSIFAIFRKTGNFDISSIVSKAMQDLPSWSPKISKTFISRDIGIGNFFMSITPYDKSEALSNLHSMDGLYIVSDARIDYRIELADQMGIDGEEFNKLSNSELILLAYRKWGSQCVKRLYGDFAFVIWDSTKKELFCARDHFGCRPLFFIDEPEYCAVASDIMTFRVLPGFSFELDEKYTVDAMCSIYPEKNASGFKKVIKLEPAHYIVTSLDIPLRPISYWHLQVKENYAGLSENEAIEGLKIRFIEAVKQRVFSSELIGVELSGGLDSSSILSCLIKEKKTRKNIYTFSHVGSSIIENNYGVQDEKSLINHQLESLDLSNSFFITGDQVQGCYSAIISALHNTHKPIIQGFSVMSDLLYEVASRNGINVLLSGFGGDEGVTDYGSGVVEEIAKKKERQLIHSLILKDDKNKELSFFRLIIKYYILYIAPWVLRFIKRYRSNLMIIGFPLNKELFKCYEIEKRFKKQLFFPNFSDVKQRQYHRINHSYICDRLEDSYLNSRRWGIEYRYPFLDVKLLEFYFSIDSVYKYKYRMGRYAFRQAMEGIVSDMIRLRQEKSGATIPNIYNRINKDKEAFIELITEGSKNNKFHFVDYGKLIEMLNSLSDSRKMRLKIRPRAFLSAVSVLILQKWQRDGSIDIGIKC